MVRIASKFDFKILVGDRAFGVGVYDVAATSNQGKERARLRRYLPNKLVDLQSAAPRTGEFYGLHIYKI